MGSICPNPIRGARPTCQPSIVGLVVEALNIHNSTSICKIHVKIIKLITALNRTGLVKTPRSIYLFICSSCPEESVDSHYQMVQIYLIHWHPPKKIKTIATSKYVDLTAYTKHLKISLSHHKNIHYHCFPIL